MPGRGLCQAQLDERATAGFWQEQRSEGGQQESDGADEEGAAQSAVKAESADDVGCDGAQHARAVVGKAEGARSNARGKQFCSDDPGTSEEAGTEECDDCAEEKDGRRTAGEGVQRNTERSGKEIDEEGEAAADTVGYESEADVSREHSGEIEEHEERGSAELGETASALFDWEARGRAGSR